MKQVKLIIVIVFIALGGTVAYGFSGGPDPGYTNAPGDIGTCVNCHDSFLLNTGGGSVSLKGLPDTYELGKTYQLTISVQQSARKRWGFEVTAITQSGDQGGQLMVSDAVNTQIKTATLSEKTRIYLEHTQAGTRLGTQGGTSWTFVWKAPATDVGTVFFYFCGNAANGDSTNQGDYIYSGLALTNSPGTQLAVRLISPTGGEVVEAGQPLDVKWETTNVAQAESHEIRLSTDGGATFPTRIAAALAPDAQSFTWNTPETLSTNTARLRVEAYPKGGLPPVAATSAANFSIVKPNAGMTITSVSPDSGELGTKVTVKITGVGFVTGSEISLGSGIKVKSITLVSASEINAKLKISANAIPGSRDLRLTTPQGVAAIKTDAFRVVRGSRY